MSVEQIIGVLMAALTFGVCMWLLFSASLERGRKMHEMYDKLGKRDEQD